MKGSSCDGRTSRRSFYFQAYLPNLRGLAKIGIGRLISLALRELKHDRLNVTSVNHFASSPQATRRNCLNVQSMAYQYHFPTDHTNIEVRE